MARTTLTQPLAGQPRGEEAVRHLHPYWSEEGLYGAPSRATTHEIAMACLRLWRIEVHHTEQGPRGSGRTFRLLAKAAMTASGGRSVFVFHQSVVEARHAFQQFADRFGDLFTIRHEYRAAFLKADEGVFIRFVVTDSNIDHLQGLIRPEHLVLVDAR